MSEPTLKDRIVDGLRESQASEIRELEEQIEQTNDKLRRLTSKRDQLIRDSEQRVAELAAVQTDDVGDRYDQRDHNDQEQWR